MSVIDGSTCNAATTVLGCGQTPATVSVGGAPGLAVVDDATHTVYVTNVNDATVSVVDATACNGRDASGCGQTRRPTAPVGASPQGLVLDSALWDALRRQWRFGHALGCRRRAVQRAGREAVVSRTRRGRSRWARFP